MIYVILNGDVLYTHQYFTEEQIDSAIEAIRQETPDVDVKAVPLTMANI